MKIDLVLPLLLLPELAGHFSLAMAQPGAFTPTGSMTTARLSHTATLLNDGTVLIAGGVLFSDGTWSASTSAELYHPSTRTFTVTGNMTTARLYQTATLLPDGKVLIAGGMDGQSNPLATAEVYDPRSGTFTATGNMTVARGAPAPRAGLPIVGKDISLPDGPTATLLPDGKVLIAGGYDRESHLLATAELYDRCTGTFTSTGDMTVALRAPMATLLADGRVLIAGLWNAELYDTSAGTFTATVHMTTVRLYPSVARLPDGKILIAGGMDGESDPQATAELFDPATGTFTVTGSMTTRGLDYPWNGRSLQTSTPLPDGSVLIAGGWPNPGMSRTWADLYDPVSGTFSATGDMATGRCLHTATLLTDGSVLVAGGIENYDSVFRGTTPRVLASVELYHPAVLAPPPALLSLSGDGRGQGAIQHADTYQLVLPTDPAAAGEALIIYCTGLAGGTVIPPQVAIGGRLAEVLWFGNTPGFAGLNQVNIRMPSGVEAGAAVSVRLNYAGRPSNEVTIAVR
jgi:WD40 repeat protein